MFPKADFQMMMLLFKFKRLLDMARIVRKKRAEFYARLKAWRILILF